jgi:hypothetical protein
VCVGGKWCRSSCPPNRAVGDVWSRGVDER